MAHVPLCPSSGMSQKSVLESNTENRAMEKLGMQNYDCVCEWLTSSARSGLIMKMSSDTEIRVTSGVMAQHIKSFENNGNTVVTRRARRTAS